MHMCVIVAVVVISCHLPSALWLALVPGLLEHQTIIVALVHLSLGAAVSTGWGVLK